MSLIDEIKKDEILSQLPAAAMSYGIQGGFVEQNGAAYFVCGPKSTDVMFDTETLMSLTHNNSTNIDNHEVAIFRLDGCNAEETLADVLEYCENLNYLRPVYENKFVCELDETVRKFGLYGTYVINEKDLETSYSGIYFVCSTDKNFIQNGNIDIRKIIEEDKNNPDFFNYNLAVFRLTDEEPYAVHQNVVEFSRNSELIRNLYKKYNEPIPETISVNGFMTMRTMYFNSLDPKLSSDARKSYENALHECFCAESVYHDPTNPEYKKYKFMCDGHYDISKSKMSNWFRQTFGRDNNKVSLEQLFSATNAAIGHMTLNVQLAEQLQAELRKHPEILYWMSDVHGENEASFFAPDIKDYDTRTVDFAYSIDRREQILSLIYPLEYPDAVKTTAKEMAQHGAVAFQLIPEDDYDNFLSLAKANDFIFCIDNDMHSSTPQMLPIAYFEKDEDMLDAILSRLSKEAEDFHLDVNQPISSALDELSFCDFDRD